MQWLSMSNHEGSMLQTALGVPEIRKYLPPGTIRDLFELFDVNTTVNRVRNSLLEYISACVQGQVAEHTSIQGQIFVHLL